MFCVSEMERKQLLKLLMCHCHLLPAVAGQKCDEIKKYVDKVHFLTVEQNERRYNIITYLLQVRSQ